MNSVFAIFIISKTPSRLLEREIMSIVLETFSLLPEELRRRIYIRYLAERFQRVTNRLVVSVCDLNSLPSRAALTAEELLSYVRAMVFIRWCAVAGVVTTVVYSYGWSTLRCRVLRHMYGGSASVSVVLFLHDDRWINGDLRVDDLVSVNDNVIDRLFWAIQSTVDFDAWEHVYRICHTVLFTRVLCTFTPFTEMYLRSFYNPFKIQGFNFDVL